MNGLRAIASQLLAWAVLGGVLILAMPAAEAATPASAKRKAAAVSKPAPSAKGKARLPVRSTKARSPKRKVVAVKFVPRPSFGELSGLHGTFDPLALRSSVAFVVDQDTQEVLFEKNAQAVLPIASITKLMTSLVVVEADAPLDELITVTQDDVDTEKGSRSRLVLGTQLTRGELLHLALMSSENRAAHALGRQHPGGLKAFVSAMNAKAMLLGMKDTRFVEPTGLSSNNQSTARDLATLAAAASEHPLIRELSTSPEHSVAVGPRTLHFRNTNRLVLNPEWDIGLQKTGYITEAGRCLVMQAQLAGRKLIMIFLDSAGRYSRLGDAERVRQWIEAEPAAATPPAAQPVLPRLIS